MKQLLTVFLGFIFVAALAAQPSIEWQKCFGGSKSDVPLVFLKLTDGNYIIGGQVLSNDGDISGLQGPSDIWLAKIDQLGSIIWQHTYGGSSSERPVSIQEATVGGYIMLGVTSSEDGDVSGYHGGSSDIWVVKMDEDGGIEWQKTYGGTGTDSGSSMLQHINGGYIIGGSTNSTDGDVSNSKGLHDGWVIRINEAGNILWEHSYGGSGQDFGSIFSTNGSGYILGLTTGSYDGDVNFGNHGSGDVWLAKLTDTGSIAWKRIYGGSGQDNLGMIMQTSDGGYLVTSYTKSNDFDVSGNHGEADLWVLKLNAIGLVQWKKTLGGSDFDFGGAIFETDEHDFILSCTTGSSDGDISVNYGSDDAWLIKLSSTGSLLWEKTYGGTYSENGGIILPADDGGLFMLRGTYSNDIDVSGNNGSQDFWLVKFSPELVSSNEPVAAQSGVLDIFPNPSQESITLNIPAEETLLQVKITDMLGREVVSQRIQTGGSVSVAALPNGIYWAIATTLEGKVYSNKFKKQE